MNPTKPAKVNPQNILGAIDAFNVTTMFGSPALLNRVGRYGEAQGIKVPSLRRVISAGAPVPAPTMAQWHQMMPESGEILPPYGATESLPVACISSREILGETWAKTEQGLGVCVGSPFAELDVAIIPISDQPIENFEESSRLDTEEIGEICVRGAVVTDQYWNADRHNKLGKMKSPEGVWHRMGDLGYFDEQGRLWFCGRKAHRVQIGSKCLFSIPTEAPFNTHPKVFRTALVGPTNRENKRVAALCVEFEQGLSPQEQTQTLEELKEIRDSFDNLKMISVLLPHPSFPVDIRHNAKINREALKEWAEKELR
jgi:acyl-CoA synthetase (AMP-forming)/AMP-acid ligase II